MDKRAQVTINRGQGQLDTFDGIIRAETTTHIGVQVAKDSDVIEYFAIESPRVKTRVI